MVETWLRESRVRLSAWSCLKDGCRSGVPRQRNLFDKLRSFVSNYHTSFFDTNKSPVVYRTSTSACHAGNMAAGEQGSALRLVILETWLQECPHQRNLFDKLRSFVSNYHTSFFDTNKSPVVYRTSTSACHAGNMAAGEQRSTSRPSHTLNMVAGRRGSLPCHAWNMATRLVMLATWPRETFAKFFLSTCNNVYSLLVLIIPQRW